MRSDTLRKWPRCTPAVVFSQSLLPRQRNKFLHLNYLPIGPRFALWGVVMLEALMNRTMWFKSAVPAVALGAMLFLLGPTAAMAQRRGGGHSGGGYSGRSYSGGSGRSYSAPSNGRSYSGG